MKTAKANNDQLTGLIETIKMTPQQLRDRVYNFRNSTIEEISKEIEARYHSKKVDLGKLLAFIRSLKKF